MTEQLRLVPCSLADARAFTAAHHRRLPTAGPGHLWSIGVAVGATPVGVAIVGRPVARMLDDGWTVEVTRCTTDGTKNACSMLYAAVWRGAQARGYLAATTMTDADEDGASLRGAGWRVETTERPERSGWDCPTRKRPNTSNPARLRWWAPGAREAPVPVEWPTAASAQPALFDVAATLAQ
mgnify:CR=1 FL=1